MLSVTLLGTPSLAWDGAPFELSRRQARALIYRLAADAVPLPRGQLSFLFWPDVDDRKARQNLTRLVSFVRGALPDPDVLVITHDAIGLDPGRSQCDSRQFSYLLERGDEPAQARAVALYGGPFLAGFDLPGSPEYENWLFAEQGRYEERYLGALAKMVDYRAVAGDHDGAIAYARRYLATDELAEEIHRRLITLYGAAGDRAAVQRQYERCVTILERELGVDPLPDTRAAFQAVLVDETSAPAVEHLIPTLEPRWTVLPSLDLPLIGRAVAWEQLGRAYERNHSGGVIFIGGEPGVGKSRLLQEFANANQDRLILTGHGHARSRDLPYQPIVQALRLALKRPDLWAGIRSIWLAEARAILPEIGSELGQLFPDLPEPLQVDPAQAQARLFEALSQIMLGLAGRQPLLLCLDDLHWADEATLDWIEYLAGRLRDSDLCLMATYRSQEAQPLSNLRQTLRRAGLQSQIILTGLSVEAISTILDQLPAPNPQTLAPKIHHATAGNAFFVLETIRALLEQNLLADPPAVLPLPQTVQEVIQGRLGRLDPLSHQVLDAAAVLSPDIDFELLRPVTGRSETELLESVETLLGRQLLVEHGQGLRFQHDLVQAYVYESLSHWRRKALHRRSAEALLDAHHHDLTVVAGQVAGHFDAAGDAGQAIAHYKAAALAALSQYAHQEAGGFLERAVALLDEATSDESLALWLHETLADTRLIGGDFAEADAGYERALKLCPASDGLHRVALLSKLVGTLTPQDRLSEIDDYLDRAETALGPDPDREMSVEWQRAWLDVKLSRLEALYFQNRPQDMARLGREVEPVVERYATPRQKTTFSHHMGSMLLRQKRFRLSDDDVDPRRTTFQIAKDHGDAIRTAAASFGLGFFLLLAGQLEEAAGRLRWGMEIAEAHGYLPVQNQCLIYLTVVARLQGDRSLIRSLQARCQELAQIVGASYYIGVAEANQAWLDYHDHNYPEAEAGARSAVSRWTTNFYPFYWLAHWPLLDMALSRDDLATAVESAAVMLGQDQQLQGNDLMAGLQSAVDHWQHGHPDQTRIALLAAVNLAKSTNHL